MDHKLDLLKFKFGFQNPEHRFDTIETVCSAGQNLQATVDCDK